MLPPRKQRTLERLIEQAHTRLDRNQIPQALGLFRRAIQIAPGDPRAPLALSDNLLPFRTTPDLADPPPQLLASVREVESALLAVFTADRAVALAIAGELAWLAALRGDFGPALRLETEGDPRREMTFTQLLREISALAVLREDLESADRLLTHAIRDAAGMNLEINGEVVLSPLDLVYDQAIVALHRGDAERATELLPEVVRGRPDDVTVIHELARARLAAGDPEEALTILRRAVAANPTDGTTHVELARAALEGGQLDASIEAARRALGLTSATDPQAALVLGAALLRANRVEEARAAYREALRRDPGNVIATQGLR